MGKYGNFPANQIIGRPFYLTFEILDTPDEDGHVLRVITAAELHAETLIAEGSGEADAEGEEPEMNGDGALRTNRETIDNSSMQKLTFEEIEALKRESSGAGKDIVAKLLESHSAIDQKTAFSLAKYTLRKRKKYMKRFTVLPMDVRLLTNYMLYEKDAAKVFELRDEMIGLIGCWGNVHHGGNTPVDASLGKPKSRYMVVDDTGGLVVAALAERMGILYPDDGEDDTEPETVNPDGNAEAGSKSHSAKSSRPNRHQAMSASENTITIIHANSSPNLALLRFFGYDQASPDESHPLHTHLKTVSWLQLADPSSDPIYSQEPPEIPEAELATWKTNKRGGYYRKRHRWTRVKGVVDEARAGGFDGLIVSSLMEPAGILKHCVPLVTGSASVVVYSANIEPLTELADLYSTARRTTYIHQKRELEERIRQRSSGGETEETDPELEADRALADEFIIDPTLLLPPTLQTSRVRPWQVLPGRTHPMMSGRGGAEGYIFHGFRVFPSGLSQAGGFTRKKRKLDDTVQTPTTGDGSGVDIEMAA